MKTESNFDVAWGFGIGAYLFGGISLWRALAWALLAFTIFTICDLAVAHFWAEVWPRILAVGDLIRDMFRNDDDFWQGGGPGGYISG